MYIHRGVGKSSQYSKFIYSSHVDIYIYSRFYIYITDVFYFPHLIISISHSFLHILFNLNILINRKIIRAVLIATRSNQSTTFVKMKRAETASLGHLFFHSNQGMKMNHVLSQISLSSLSLRKG